jgi:hypothetical protein
MAAIELIGLVILVIDFISNIAFRCPAWPLCNRLKEPPHGRELAVVYHQYSSAAEECSGAVELLTKTSFIARGRVDLQALIAVWRAKKQSVLSLMSEHWRFIRMKSGCNLKSKKTSWTAFVQPRVAGWGDGY